MAVTKSDQLLLAVRCGSHQNKNTRSIFFEADVEVNAIRPRIYVLFAFQTAFAPVAVFVLPVRFQAGYRRGTQSCSVWPQQRCQCLGKVTRADFLEVQPGHQVFDALGLTQIGRHNLHAELFLCLDCRFEHLMLLTPQNLGRHVLGCQGWKYFALYSREWETHADAVHQPVSW